jgi:spermidine synthase
MKSLRYWIPLICFFSGGSVMLIELAGIRLLAPVFGNSLYTWTALIGVILFALSAGDWIGGWLVDRKPSLGLVALFFSLASVMTFLIVPCSGDLESMSTMDLRWGPLAASLLLFFAPACLLAAITPTCVRLLSRVSHDKHVGLSAGTVGMCGAVGSFCGTILSGFYLIPEFGVRRVFLVLGLLQLALAALVCVLHKTPRGKLSALAGIWLISGMLAIMGILPQPASRQTVYLKDTPYHRIKVTEVSTLAGEKIRYLWQDTVLQGGEYVGSEKPGSPYLYYWQLAQVYAPELRSALFVGGGAFVMPKRIAAAFPGSVVDVVEIDPATVEVGNAFFNLQNHPAVRVHNDDARRFMRNATAQWDLIFCDAYSGLYSMPAHLVTREFFQGVRDKLNPGGVCMINFAGVVEGPNARLFHTFFNTVKSVFPNVVVYAVESPMRLTDMQNLIFVASAARDLDKDAWNWLAAHAGKPEAQPLAALLSNRCNILPDARWNGMVFEDDRNPVELLTVQMCVGLAEERKFRN